MACEFPWSFLNQIERGVANDCWDLPELLLVFRARGLWAWRIWVRVIWARRIGAWRLVVLPGFRALGGIRTLLVTVEVGDMTQVFLSLVDSSSGCAAGFLWARTWPTIRTSILLPFLLERLRLGALRGRAWAGNSTKPPSAISSWRNFRSSQQLPVRILHWEPTKPPQSILVQSSDA